nr:response regulator transcription factor [Acidimicrobiia bacterium]
LDARLTAAVDPLAGLTEAERRIAEAAAEGLRNRDVADRLFISERTVETHLERAYRKLGVANRTQLAARVRSGGAGH